MHNGKYLNELGSRDRNQLSDWFSVLILCSDLRTDKIQMSDLVSRNHNGCPGEACQI